MISAVFFRLIYEFLSLKNDVNIPVFIRIWIFIRRIRMFLTSRIRLSEVRIPDPYQYDTDPQHGLKENHQMFADPLKEIQSQVAHLKRRK